MARQHLDEEGVPDATITSLECTCKAGKTNKQGPHKATCALHLVTADPRASAAVRRLEVPVEALTEAPARMKLASTQRWVYQRWRKSSLWVLLCHPSRITPG